MKITQKLLFAVLLLLGWASFASAQTSLTQTTLSAAQNVGPAAIASGIQGSSYQTTVSLASATGITQAFNGQPVTFLYIDQELEAVQTLVSGQTTIFNVLRGQQGTKAQAHASGAVVYVEVVTPQFGGFSGSGGMELTDPPAGANCTGANTLLTPWINIITGEQWVCDPNVQLPSTVTINSAWIPASNYLYMTQNAPKVVYATAAYTNATTTYSNVAGLAFFAQANRNYQVSCNLTWQVSGTVGPKYQFTGPASPTAVAINVNGPLTATTMASASVVAFSSSDTGQGGTVTTTTNFQSIVTLGLLNGTTSGTVQLQAAENGAGTLTIQPGSYCAIQ